MTHQPQVDDSKLAAAHYLLRPFSLRRLKDEVERSLPPKTDTTIACPLSECQTFWYRRRAGGHDFLCAFFRSHWVSGFFFSWVWVLM